jgi:hypothetical protein
VAKRITIQLVGAKDDQGNVRLSDFTDQLNIIKKALFERERLVAGVEAPHIDYKIVDLHHSNATIVIEPISVNGTAEYADKFVDGFSNELRSIKKTATLTDEPDVERLRTYQKIGHRPDNMISKVKISVGRKPVTIDESFKENVEKILGPDEFIQGTISGMLDAINFHNTNRFTLYPQLGPTRVSGTFDPPLRPKVKDAVGNFVTVIGRLRYKQWSAFPHGVVAEDIDIHEPDSSLPTLSELRGAFAGALGEKTSVEFVEQIRESW